MKSALLPSLLLLGCAFLCFGGASGEAYAQTKSQSPTGTNRAPLPVLCASAQEVHLIVDLNSTSASTQLEFCSPNDRRTAAATLTAGDFTSRMTKLGLGSSLAFSRSSGKNGTSSLSLPPIEPGTSALVKADVSNLWEAGEAEAPLRVNGVDVGRLVAVKYRLPFGVKVDAPDPTKPEIILQRDQDFDVVLKNDDQVTYVIEWDFHVAGSSLQGNSVTTPNSTGRFTVHPDRKWYRSFTGLLKDYDEDGKLTLSFRPPGATSPSYWPSKVISVKVHLRYSSETARAWIGNLLLLLVLVAGAVVSFLGSVGLPNRLKRSEYRENLLRLAQRISGISHQVDSRLRVVVRVQRKRLSEQLESRTSISADLNRVFDQVSQGTASLEKQVRLAEEIDLAHYGLKLLDAQGAGPSLLWSAEDSVWKAAEVISHIAPSDQELEQSQKYLDDATALMNRAHGLDAAIAQGLSPRSTQLQAELKVFELTSVYKKIQDALPGVFADLVVSAAPKTAEECSRLDRNLAKAELLRQFLQIYHVAENPQVRPILDKQLERLLGELSLESWEAMRTGRLLVREMQEGVYPDDLVLAARTSARIEIDPSVPVVNDLIRFTVGFGDPRLNGAAARLEFEGRWSFGHDNYSEIGWEPFHYFPKAGPSSVHFRFQSAGDREPVTVSRNINVGEFGQPWYKRDRNRAEIGRFAIALLPATFGLLAGAREQLLKMDIPSAMFAVFLLGYGSDSVKNVVSQSQQASTGSSAMPVGGGKASVAVGAAPQPVKAP